MPTYTAAKPPVGALRADVSTRLGLKRYLPICERPANGRLVRDLASARHVTPVGAFPGGNGPTGPCLVERGSGSDFGLPTSAQPRSVAAWFKWSGGTADHVLVGWGSGGTLTAAYLLGVSVANGNVPFISNWGSSVFGPTAVNDSVWHRLMATFDGTTHRLYLDGKAEGSGTMTTATTLNTVFAVGWSGYTATPLIFGGSIDCPCAWDRCLSADEARLDALDPWAPMRPSDDLPLYHAAAPAASSRMPWHLFNNRAA